MGPCKRHGAVTRFRSVLLLRECEHLFCQLVMLVPGTDDPSTPAWPGRRGAITRLFASLGTYSDRSALTASTTRSPRLIRRLTIGGHARQQ
jgi:hypothetical protein